MGWFDEALPEYRAQVQQLRNDALVAYGQCHPEDRAWLASIAKAAGDLDFSLAVWEALVTGEASAKGE